MQNWNANGKKLYQLQIILNTFSKYVALISVTVFKMQADQRTGKSNCNGNVLKCHVTLSDSTFLELNQINITYY